MIKSFLSNLPIYYMSIFKILEGVAKELDSIQSKFLWGDTDQKRKIHLVNWKKVTLCKKNGGLGIKNIKVMNEALLLKWWWRFGKEKEAL